MHIQLLVGAKAEILRIICDSESGRTRNLLKIVYREIDIPLLSHVVTATDAIALLSRTSSALQSIKKIDDLVPSTRSQITNLQAAISQSVKKIKASQPQPVLSEAG